MPISVMTDSGVKRTYDKVEIDNLVGNGLGIITSGVSKRVVVSIATGDWTSDTTGYKDATALGNIELWYADLEHNLNAEVARAVAGTGADGFLMEETQCQKPTDAATLRIWLARKPGYTTKWLVIG